MNQEKKTEDQTEAKTIIADVAKAKPQAQIDTVVAAVAATETDQPAVKAKAASKKAKSKKAAPAAKSAAPAASKKEAPVAKKTKAKTTKTAKAKSNGTGKRIPDDAVLKVSKSFKNPYKEGTGPFKRFDICAKSNGKTYGTLKAMTSLKNTTPLNFVRAGGGEFISAGK